MVVKSTNKKKKKIKSGKKKGGVPGAPANNTIPKRIRTPQKH